MANRIRTQLCSTIHADTKPRLNDLFTQNAISITDNHLDRVGPDINRADRWSIRMALHTSTLPWFVPACLMVFGCESGHFWNINETSDAIPR